MDIVMANQGGNNAMREYRKGNWTVQETMILIEAKKMDDGRRMKRQMENVAGERSGGKPAELRWKWVEDYCWRNGCLRSQNQCNDKWDNLMRDFKKVREYERRFADHQQHIDIGGGSSSERSDEKSYWKLEKNERKANNLPSNLLSQIYEALVEVVERKGQRGSVVSFVGGGGTSTSASNPNVSSSSAAAVVGQPSSLPPSMQHLPIPPPVAVLPLPPPAVAQTPVQQQQQQQHPPTLPFPQQLPTVDSDTSEHSDSPAKRRRRGEGASAAASGSNSHEVGSAISRSASIIAEAIHACEEREERRHRELLSLHERRLQIEESKAEINRQGINGLVDAVNKLANSILALASHKNQSTSK